MSKIGNCLIYLVLVFLLASLLVAIPGEAKTDKYDKKHKDAVGDVGKDLKCKSCHDKIKDKKDKKDNLLINKNAKISTAYSIQNIGSSARSIGTNGNLTAIISTGQMPYQLGAFYGPYAAGWSWWDIEQFGTEKQKNIIYLTILDNSTGTIKPVTGLAPSSWPFASFRKYNGSYSYKADTDVPPITTLNNYPDMIDLSMIRKIDLRDVNNAILTFWTWYSMETDWDYAYVVVSSDNGSTWSTVPGTLTTNNDPNGNNIGNGITGSSGGIWAKETMDLTAYKGKDVLLGFKFKSDQAINDEGFYIDDIEIKDGDTIILRDEAEAFVEGKTMSVNIIYPYLESIATPLQYSQHSRQIDLREDVLHPGTYYGYFKYDPFAEQYSGDYDITLDINIGGTQITAGMQFKTTIFGCEGCHNKIGDNTETNVIHGEGGGMASCSYICHSGSRGFYYSLNPDDPVYMGPPLPANPMHVHEMKYGHQGGFLPGAWYPQPQYNVPSHVTNVTCVQCHTSFVHDNTGTDTFKINSYTLNGTNITFSLGTHSGMTCENCHGDLSYPAIPQNQFQIQSTIGDYNPTFTSSESFTDTYIVNVDGLENLNLSISGDSRKVLLYVLGPVDNTTTALQGPCGGDPCSRISTLPMDMSIPGPYIGTWLVKVTLLQEGGKVDYTILSNYPIERKPIIKIPECKDCHNSNGQGGAYTTLEIPNWNPGFAHADTNDDGILDIQCRTCHNTMHDAETKNCRDCHATAPTGHIIEEPQFSQYTMSQCLQCHGDPHAVKSGGDACIECHGTNYTGAAPSVEYTFVDIGAYNSSVHTNVNNTPIDTINNDDCWSCHYNKDMERTNIKKCRDCHRKPQQWHGNADITTNLTELAIR